MRWSWKEPRHGERKVNDDRSRNFCYIVHSGGDGWLPVLLLDRGLLADVYSGDHDLHRAFQIVGVVMKKLILIAALALVGCDLPDRYAAMPMLLPEQVVALHKACQTQPDFKSSRVIVRDSAA